MNIAFRVDSSTFMGIGHVMRCLTLADKFKERGHKCTFICRLLTSSMEKKIILHGHQIIHLSLPTEILETSRMVDNDYQSWLVVGWKEDAYQVAQVLERNSYDWLIVDHYGVDKRWEASLRGVVKSMLVIDDLANREHVCEVLLDQTYLRKESEYYNFVSPGTVFLCGTRFALLREEFNLYRSASLSRRELPKLESSVISLGGTDPNNITVDILRAFEGIRLPESHKMTVILGSDSTALQAVSDAAKKLRWNVDIKINVTNLGQILCMADFAIGAAGTTSWERCCLGVPSGIISIASNQKQIAAALQKAGAAFIISNNNLSKGLQSFVKHLNVENLRKMVSSSSSITDGKGVERVVCVVESM